MMISLLYSQTSLHRFPNLTKVDRGGCKLGKAESGRETNQDDLIKTIDLNYSQARTEES